MQAEVVRDVASGVVIGASVGPAAHGWEVRRMLGGVALRRGGAPLVLVHDNGAAYQSQEVRGWCVGQRVLPLPNLPRTPQHNATAERGMRELKNAGAAWQEPVVDIHGARARLEAAIRRADALHPRPSLAGRTRREEDAIVPPWVSWVARDRIYEEATCRIARGVLDSMNSRARRIALREAILGTLEDHALITRTRGPRCKSC